MSTAFRPEIVLSEEGAIFCALAVGSALKYMWMARARAARDDKFTLVGHVSQLTVYPIKAGGGVSLQSALATDVGLCADGYYDRRWFVQSKELGTHVNMKTHPRLSLVTTKVDGDWLVISAPDMTPLRLPRHPDPAKCQHVIANLCGYAMRTLDGGAEAGDWMTKYLNHPVRLLHSGPGVDTRDAYDMSLKWPTTSRRGDKVVFASNTAYMLCSTASLAELNTRLDTAVDSRNFRPNIMVENAIAFDEDDWDEVRIGSSAKFHYVQPCRRCVITTVNPVTAKHHVGGQPLSTLRKYRQKAPYGENPLFGAYLALDCQGEVKVGDPVYAIRRQKSAAP